MLRPEPEKAAPRRPTEVQNEETGIQSRFLRSELLGRFFRDQDEVVSLDQLRSIGFTVDQIRHKRRGGELILVHRGVFKSRRNIPGKGYLHAALLAYGPEAFLDLRSGASVYGLRPINPYEVHVTVPGRPHRRPGSGIVVHGVAGPLHPDDVRAYANLRVAALPRLLAGLAAREPRAEVDRLITASVHRGVFDLELMRAALPRLARHPGIVVLRQALAAYVHRPQEKSGFERAFRAYLGEHPEIPTPLTNVHLGPWEIDVHWPRHGLCVELDGRPYHAAIADRDRDTRKDSWLQRHGLRIMRITDFRWTYDRGSILPELLEFLGLGRRAA